MNDLYAFRKLAVNILDRTDSRTKRITVIAMVEGVQKSTVFSDQSGFRGGRTGIDSKVGITAVAGKIANRHLMLCMAVLKFIVICFTGKERLHTLNFKVHFNMGIQLFLHLTKRGDYILFRVQRRADGCKKMGILWCDNVFVIQLESTDKRFSQFREEMKRSTEESNMSADWFSAGKTTDGLVDDCLENRSRQVFFGSTVIDQRLDICLGKYATAGCNRIKCFVIFGIFVQTGCICLEKGRHLVDERSGTSGADSVHTLLNISIFKIDDLGIFAAQLDRYIGLWCIILKSGGNGNNLLDKRYAKMLCQSKTT